MAFPQTAPLVKAGPASEEESAGKRSGDAIPDHSYCFFLKSRNFPDRKENEIPHSSEKKKNLSLHAEIKIYRPLIIERHELGVPVVSILVKTKTVQRHLYALKLTRGSSLVV